MRTGTFPWLYLTVGVVACLLILLIAGSGAEKDRWLAVAGHCIPALLLIYKWSSYTRRIGKMRAQMQQHLINIDQCLDRIARAVE
jgi:hypothetical protein